MIEIRFHGRGGQGAVVASEILARAAFKEGKDVQAFPFFGVERRGAPVTAYARFDDRPIRVKSSVYDPDYVVVLDASLLGTVDVREGLKKNGMILINTDKPPDRVGLEASRLAAVNATDIAIRHGLGSKAAPIVNTAILGAFSKATEEVTLDSILESISESVPRKVEENLAAAKEAYERVKI
jgi:2-oxoacid:acceptor oxidoreductase gamma subunit (pyruvate/2-ketoisovalerate family)